MSMKIPGFDERKLHMSSREKQALSESELNLQVQREKNLSEVVFKASSEGSLDENITNDIRDEALAENLDKAEVDEVTVAGKIGHQSHAKEDENALAEAQRKVRDAYHLIEQGKKK